MSRRQFDWIVFWFFAGFIALCVGIGVLHAIIIYDDWRCAFGDCRIVKEQP